MEIFYISFIIVLLMVLYFYPVNYNEKFEKLINEIKEEEYKDE